MSVSIKKRKGSSVGMAVTSSVGHLTSCSARSKTSENWTDLGCDWFISVDLHHKNYWRIWKNRRFSGRSYSFTKRCHICHLLIIKWPVYWEEVRPLNVTRYLRMVLALWFPDAMASISDFKLVHHHFKKTVFNFSVHFLLWNISLKNSNSDSER